VLPSIHQDHHSAKSASPDGHAEGGEHEVERYPVTTVDFSRVETPFIIGIWILFASIAKIGKSIDNNNK
jgi:sodium/hydrogen exchanger-like protein 3